MKERPIIFSAPMVRAILAGRKTQTRRAVANVDADGTVWKSRHRYRGVRPMTDAPPDILEWCPYGQPGDRLWVREPFDFIPSGGPDEPQACEIVYWATGSNEPRTAPSEYNPMIYGREKVRPSIHMPRWASRITLEVVSVRVERLQDISDPDAMAEGCSTRDMRHGDRLASVYARLWESINGAGSWDANPWVWVVQFQSAEGGAA